MTRAIHSSLSSVLPLRIVQCIFAVLVMSLSAYTLSVFTEWKHVRFTVGAVNTLDRKGSE